jgi:hypothetical protein
MDKYETSDNEDRHFAEPAFPISVLSLATSMVKQVVCAVENRQEQPRKKPTRTGSVISGILAAPAVAATLWGQWQADDIDIIAPGRTSVALPHLHPLGTAVPVVATENW